MTLEDLDPVSSGDPHVAAHNLERTRINEILDDLGLKIAAPTTPQVGEWLRFDGTKWARSTSRLFEGTGDPNGSVAGPIGSHYIDTAGTAGGIRWVKASGSPTSNTGWVVEFGDTKTRDIKALIATRGSGVVNTATLRRFGPIVDMYLDMKMPTSTATPFTVYTLPSGFRPATNRYGGLQDNNESAAATTYVSAAGLVNLNNIVSAKTDRWVGTWMTDDEWPSALPGVAL